MSTGAPTSLVRQGVTLLSPPTDQAFGHRTVFFRDPDGNLLEVFAEIASGGR
jgi:catechol 2,3-dioxygenase-like lactoylglutathione lyase family enzyme